jgi:hypothetical protein
MLGLCSKLIEYSFVYDGSTIRTCMIPFGLAGMVMWRSHSYEVINCLAGLEQSIQLARLAFGSHQVQLGLIDSHTVALRNPTQSVLKWGGLN